MTHLSNVYQTDGSRWAPSQESIYGAHLESVLRQLRMAWGPRYDHFEFLIYYHRVYSKIPRFERTGKRIILIFLSDEEGLIPEELGDQFFAILKTYWPLPSGRRNIISFPIGYSNSSRFCEFIPFEQRRIPVSYAGNFLPNRLDFYRQLSMLKWLPPFQISSLFLKKCYWHIYMRLGLYKPGERTGWIPDSRLYFSGGFAQGLAREDYAAILSNSKIALCPKGFISTECFRIFEAMRLGCVIVTDALPPTVWYRDAPFIISTDWLNIRSTVELLLRDPAHLEKIHEETLAWWGRVCCDEAAARWIAGELQCLDSR